MVNSMASGWNSPEAGDQVYPKDSRKAWGAGPEWTAEPWKLRQAWADRRSTTLIWFKGRSLLGTEEWQGCLESCDLAEASLSGEVVVKKNGDRDGDKSPLHSSWESPLTVFEIDENVVCEKEGFIFTLIHFSFIAAIVNHPTERKNNKAPT